MPPKENKQVLKLNIDSLVNLLCPVQLLRDLSDLEYEQEISNAFSIIKGLKEPQPQPGAALNLNLEDFKAINAELADANAISFFECFKKALWHSDNSGTIEINKLHLSLKEVIRYCKLILQPDEALKRLIIIMSVEGAYYSEKNEKMTFYGTKELIGLFNLPTFNIHYRHQGKGHVEQLEIKRKPIFMKLKLDINEYPEIGGISKDLLWRGFENISKLLYNIKNPQNTSQTTPKQSSKKTSEKTQTETNLEETIPGLMEIIKQDSEALKIMNSNLKQALAPRYIPRFGRIFFLEFETPSNLVWSDHGVELINCTDWMLSGSQKPTKLENFKGLNFMHQERTSGLKNCLLCLMEKDYKYVTPVGIGMHVNNASYIKIDKFIEVNFDEFENGDLLKAEAIKQPKFIMELGKPYSFKEIEKLPLPKKEQEKQDEASNVKQERQFK